MIRDLHKDDRPREKALIHGIGSLTNAELLAILLRVGIQGRSVVDVAQDILEKFQNDLSRIVRSTPAELTQLVPGIGPAKAMTVIAALELGSRCRDSLRRQKPSMASSEAVYEYMSESLEGIDHEEFWVLILNRRLAIESKELVSLGGMDSTVVDLRILVKKVLDARASGVILVHNHPSGQLRPSPQDDALTRRIQDACKFFDIKVYDHVIIGPGGFYSYSDQGRL